MWVDRYILSLLSHVDLGAIFKLLPSGALGCCSMGKHPGSYSYKGLEAAKDLEAEKETLPWLARTGARSLLSVQVVTLRLKGHSTQSEKTLDPYPLASISDTS